MNRRQIIESVKTETSGRASDPIPMLFRPQASRRLLVFSLGLVTLGSPLLAGAQGKWATTPSTVPNTPLAPPPVSAPAPAWTPPQAQYPVSAPAPAWTPPQAQPPVSAPAPMLPPAPAPGPAPVYAPTPAPVPPPVLPQAQSASFPEEQPAITMRLAEIPPAPIKPEEELMDFASFGLRLGYQFDSLEAAGGFPMNDLKMFNGHTLALALTAHFGRSGYFTRLDVPTAIGQHSCRAGIGFYPVGVAYLFPNARVMPYAAAGGLGGMLFARYNYTAPASGERQRFGIYGQVRTVLGMKVFPLRHLALSFEIGYSPYIIGNFPKVSTTAPKKTYPEEAAWGMTWDTNIGVEWH